MLGACIELLAPGAGAGGHVVPSLCEHMFVRWSNLTVEEEPQHRLPGYRDPASVRRFDAPEALDMRFYEVRSKSVLNKVPEASQMPFRWTVNPYRGCSHACNYCFARPTHTYLGFDAGRDFEREIVVKVNAPEVLRAELARPSWRGGDGAPGTHTHPPPWGGGGCKRKPGSWVAGRARRARNQHRPLPVGRGTLQADAGDLGGAAGCPQPVLDPHQVAAAAARHRADEAAARAGWGVHRVPLGPDARREGMARNRAAHPQPASATRGGGGAEPGGNSHGGAPRPADARDQRRARPGGAAARSRRAGRRDEHRRHRPAPAGGGARRLHGLDASQAPRPRSALRGALQAPRLRPPARTGAPLEIGRQERLGRQVPPRPVG